MFDSIIQRNRPTDGANNGMYLFTLNILFIVLFIYWFIYLLFIYPFQTAVREVFYGRKRVYEQQQKIEVNKLSNFSFLFNEKFYLIFLFCSGSNNNSSSHNSSSHSSSHSGSHNKYWYVYFYFYSLCFPYPEPRTYPLKFGVRKILFCITSSCFQYPKPANVSAKIWCTPNCFFVICKFIKFSFFSAAATATTAADKTTPRAAATAAALTNIGIYLF